MLEMLMSLSIRWRGDFQIFMTPLQVTSTGHHNVLDVTDMGLADLEMKVLRFMPSVPTRWEICDNPTMCTRIAKIAVKCNLNILPQTCQIVREKAHAIQFIEPKKL